MTAGSSGVAVGSSAALRVLVTGGAGFIGRSVVRRLVADGVDVVVLDSLRADVHPGGAAPRLPPSVRVDVGDVRDRDQVARAMRGVDVAVHLAAKVGLGVDLGDLDDYVSSNDLGTAVVLQGAARAGVERLVVASSMVVYGEGAYRCVEHGLVQPAARREVDLAAGRFEPGCPLCGEPLAPELVAEEAVTDPRNGYAATKLHQEHLASVWSRETGGQARALRFHNVYGPGLPKNTPYAGVAALFASALQRGEAPRVFEDGGQRRDFVHVDDVAAAVVAGVCAPSTRPIGELRAFNVGSGVVHTIGDLATAMATSWGGPLPVVTGDYRLGDVRHVTASSARIAEELGWTARVRFEDGIEQLASAWRPVQPTVSDR
jgi:dTDP-L-rhamnose 4-epimerase